MQSSQQVLLISSVANYSAQIVGVRQSIWLGQDCSLDLLRYETFSLRRTALFLKCSCRLVTEDNEIIKLLGTLRAHEWLTLQSYERPHVSILFKRSASEVRWIGFWGIHTCVGTCMMLISNYNSTYSRAQELLFMLSLTTIISLFRSECKHLISMKGQATKHHHARSPCACCRDRFRYAYHDQER